MAGLYAIQSYALKTAIQVSNGQAGNIARARCGTSKLRPPATHAEAFIFCSVFFNGALYVALRHSGNLGELEDSSAICCNGCRVS